jgi:radical SAM protein with 4Fe4S-binding SPASM domain
MNPYQTIMQKTFDGRIPFTAHFELTYKCNLSCVHCYATNRKLENELTTAEVEDVLRQLAEMKCLFLALTGGEILLRTDILQILKTARQLGFALHLFTNGTLMTPGLADEVAKAEPLSVDMSLYSMTPGIHDAITTMRGSHEKTVKAISLCRERSLNVSVKTMLMKHNVSEYRAIREFVERIGAKLVVDFALAPADDGSRPMEKHGLSEDEIYEFIRENAEKTQDQPKPLNLSDPLCGAGSNVICIGPGGDVFPCLAVRQSAGNVRRGTLRGIWDSSSLDKLRGMRYCSLNECRECELISYCSRCSGVAFAECGNILGRSDSACVVARATKRAMNGLAHESGTVRHVQGGKA